MKISITMLVLGIVAFFSAFAIPLNSIISAALSVFGFLFIWGGVLSILVHLMVKNNKTTYTKAR